MKIIGAAECCGSAASKPGQAHVAAAPSSTQAPAMGVLKKPASKLQGILKKPAASRDLALVPYQAAQEEPEDEEAEQDDLQEEDEEEVQEQPQEEEEEEEGDEVEDEKKDAKPRKDAKPAKARRLSKQALQDHNLFLKEAKDLSEEDFDHFFKKLNEKQKQCLWKKFETSRQANPGAEQAFKDGTGTGSGQVARKRGMLRGWVFDGGKPAKFFKQSSVEFSCTRSSGLQASWLSYKETCDKIGEEELKARVAAGTIQHRKNPEDRRFFQFKLHKAWCCAKFITADSGESCRFTLSGNRRHHHLPQNWLQGPGQSGRHPPGHRFLRQPQGGTLR